MPWWCILPIGVLFIVTTTDDEKKEEKSKEEERQQKQAMMVVGGPSSLLFVCLLLCFLCTALSYLVQRCCKKRTTMRAIGVKGFKGKNKNIIFTHTYKGKRKKKFDNFFLSIISIIKKQHSVYLLKEDPLVSQSIITITITITISIIKCNIQDAKEKQFFKEEKE